MSITLSPNEIHLWFVSTEDIDDDELLERYQKIISDEEMKKYRRFVFEKDRTQYLVTRALIRSVLSIYIRDTLPEGWQFILNDYGKPEVVPEMLPFPLKFNLSHTNNMIVLAISHDQDVGVDVESLARDLATDDLAKYAFSSEEYEQIKGLDSVSFHKRFFDFWTLKESYIKACGMGLSIPLDSFSFLFSEENRVSIRFDRERNDDPKLWKFWQIKPSEQHIVSLAIKIVRSNLPYKLVMREIVPFTSYSDVSYPTTSESA